MEIYSRDVPAPKTVPYYPEAGAVGLLSCLKHQYIVTHFRCANCRHLYSYGGIVEVPDGITLAWSESAIREECRRTAHNGYYSGWCMSCARKLGAVHVKKLDPVFFTRRFIAVLVVLFVLGFLASHFLRHPPF